MFGRQVLTFGSQNFRIYLTLKGVKINRKYHKQLFHRAAVPASSSRKSSAKFKFKKSFTSLEKLFGVIIIHNCCRFSYFEI